MNNLNAENTNNIEEAKKAIKKAKIINSCIIFGLIFAIIGFVVFNSWLENKNKDYIGGNVLNIPQTGVATTGNIWKNDSFVTQLVWASLFATDATFTEVNPYLAEDVVTSPDGLTYTITLRDDLYWSDGTPLTVDDVVFSIESFLLCSGTGLTVTNAFTRIVGAEEWQAVGVQSWENGGTHSLEGVKSSGNTVTIQLDAAYSAFALALTQFSPLPKHCLIDINPSTYVSDISEFFSNPPASSGMYKVDCINEDDGLELVHNEYYFDASSDIERVIMHTDYQNMYIDYHTTSSPSEMTSYRSIIGINEYTSDVPYYRYFVFNLAGGYEQPEMIPLVDDSGNEVLDGDGNTILVASSETVVYDENRPENVVMQDVILRQAISLAIDREKLMDEVYMGSGTTTLGDASSDEYNNFLLEYNPTKAKQLLEQSGYDLDRALTIGFYHTDVSTAVYLDGIKEYLEAIGFKVVLKQLNGSVELYDTKEYDMLLKAYAAMASIDWYTEYLTTNTNLYKTIHTDEFDVLMDNLYAATTDEEYNDAFKKLQDLDSATMYKLPLSSVNDAVYIDGNRVSIPADMEFGNIRYRSNLRFDEWYIKKD